MVRSKIHLTFNAGTCKIILKSEMGVKNESTVAFFICLHNCFRGVEFSLPCSAVVLSLRCPGWYSQHVIESAADFSVLLLA